MIQHICFLVATILYDTAKFFAIEFAAAFERQGIETSLVHVGKKKLSEEAIREMVSKRPTLTFSFSAVYPIKPHVFMSDELGIPHWTFTLDPAAYFASVMDPKLALFSSVDRNECTVFATQSKAAFFMPHAISQDLLKAPWDQERCYDVVFIGSCYDYEALQSHWQKELPRSHSQVLERAAELVLGVEQIPPMAALAKAWGESGEDAQGVNFLLLFIYLDHYTRGLARVEMVRAFRNTTVHIFGDLYPSECPSCVKGWEGYLGDQSHVVVHPSIPFNEVSDILRKSKFCLNSMPFFKNGSHERVLMTLACGALPISSPSRWLEEEFSVDEELLIYRADDSERIQEKMSLLLTDEDERRHRAASGRDKVAAHHTWDHRAATALETLPFILEKIYNSVL